MQARVAVWVLCASSIAAACEGDKPAPSSSTKDAMAEAGLSPDASVSDASSGADADRPDGAEGGPPKGPPPEVLADPKGWPMANHDYRATRAAVGSTITRANVSRLEEAWSFEIPGGGTFGAATAVPIVIGDVIYYQDMGSNVF